MSGWIPIPNLDQALILMVRYPCASEGNLSERDHDESARLERVIDQLAGESGSAVYVFHDPPEAGDEAEEWLGQWTDRIALAPQAFGSAELRINGAFRRIFSRANTRKAVIADLSLTGWGLEDVNRLFRELDVADAAACVDAYGRVPLFGSVRFFADFRIDLGQAGAAEHVRQFASQNGLQLAEFSCA